VAEESASWKVVPSKTHVSVAARAGQDVSRGQFEQITSVPVEGLPIAGIPGQIPQTEAIAGVATPGSGVAVTGQMPQVEETPVSVMGHIAQAMAEFATPDPGLAVTGQIGQAIVDCATGGTGQAGDTQLPSSGQAVCAGEVAAVAEGSATGEPHGPPPTPMHTPAPLPVEPERLPLTAEALDTGAAAAGAPPEL
jgi:hypothetical protein